MDEPDSTNQVEFMWHIHHHILVEPLVRPVKDRQRYIKTEKPKSERELRLRLLKPVMGSLPEAYVKAAQAYVDATAAPHGTPGRYVAIDDAKGRMVKARRENTEAINALHELECLDCPWDAKRRSIFPVRHNPTW